MQPSLCIIIIIIIIRRSVIRDSLQGVFQEYLRHQSRQEDALNESCSSQSVCRLLSRKLQLFISLLSKTVLSYSMLYCKYKTNTSHRVKILCV